MTKRRRRTCETIVSLAEAAAAGATFEVKHRLVGQHRTSQSTKG